MQNVLGWAWDEESNEPYPEFPAPKVGDVLRVREDLSIYMPGVVSEMLKHAGKEVVVDRLHHVWHETDVIGSVAIDADNGVWNWFCYCFEPPVLEELDAPDDEDFLRFIGA